MNVGFISLGCSKNLIDTETVIGKFNSIPGTSQAFVIGNGTGTATSNRSNAMTVDWSGNQTLAGSLTVGRDPTSNMEVATKQYVDNNSSNDNMFRVWGDLTLKDIILDGNKNKNNQIIKHIRKT